MQQSHIKSEIRNWTRLELRQWLEKQSEQDSKIQPYRADQIFYWLYRRKVQDFSEMANIVKPTRNLLEKAELAPHSIMFAIHLYEFP